MVISLQHAVPGAVALVGLLVYLLAPGARTSEAGRIAYAAGLVVLLLVLCLLHR